jgi:hypothetical protein
MSTAVWTNRLEMDSVADKILTAAARFWFLVAVIGQWMFVAYLVAFYGRIVAGGDLSRVNKFLSHGYIPGDTLGNLALATHILLAVVITVGGPLQLIPQVRDRFPVFHHRNGRIYLLTAFTTSIAGLYMTWIRGTVGDLSQHLGSTLNVILIVFCGVMALRYALARDFKTHRRWAIRLFLVVSASWFLRVGLFLSLVLFKGPFGFDPATFRGPFLTFMTFAQSLFPLAVFEIYLRAQDRPGAFRRMAMAGGLVVLTLGMAAGVFAVSTVEWLPKVKSAYDTRISIAGILAATIASSGVDAAAKQYHNLITSSPAAYNFDESELNSLGYTLIRTKRFDQAIGIFQLNVEAYPQSSNAYDSLGEAYMDNGDKPLAIANYQKSLELNPKNHNAVLMLQKLNAP